MSIFNKELEYYLASIGEKFLSKYGQAAAKSPIDIAKSLLNNLGPALSANKFSKSTGGDASPSVKDLNNLNSLLSFLSENLVLYNGKFIAYRDAETGKLDLDNEGLKEYIIKLRSDAIDSNNKLFILFVGKLIREANKKYNFGIQDITSDSIEKEKAQTSDNYQLDVLPNVINPEQPLAPGFYAPLMASDLSSREALQNWVNSHDKIQLIDIKTKKPSEINMDNICQFLNVLFLRAKTPDKYDIGGKKDGLKKLYMQRVSALASTFSCSLSAATSSDATSTDKATMQGSESAKEIVEEVSMALPLGGSGPTAIDLRKIQKFINIIQKQIIPNIPKIKELNGMSDHIEDLKTWSNNCLTAINYVSKLPKTSAIFPWNFNNESEVHKDLKSIFGSNTEAIQGTDGLAKVIQNVGFILYTLYGSEFGKAIQDKLNTQYNLSRNYHKELVEHKVMFINAPKVK